jgi:hypothetical protein
MVDSIRSQYLVDYVFYVLLTPFPWTRVVLNSLQRWQHSVKRCVKIKLYLILHGFNVTYIRARKEAWSVCEG